ncbi:MAG: nucleotidyltransferase family protein, partial [Clostridiales bacterium]|nr:nucleotidyltransferase family protein [Clostridiales bacterium]
VYHMQEAKKACNADTVIGIMSGFFVQRAEPAVVSPNVRAKAAIMCGMDAVLEMPVAFSCATGELFARGAIHSISHIHGINYLAMGVEDNPDLLIRIAEIQSQESAAYQTALKLHLDKGMPYAAAITAATATVIGDRERIDCEAALHKPNNVLAVEYVKAIYRRNLSIRPIFIPRKGNGYNNTDTSGEYISATAARTLLQEGDTKKLRPYIPPHCLQELLTEYATHRIQSRVYNALSVHALRTRNIADAFDACEGIDKRLTACAMQYASLEEIVSAAKSKRYTISRIKRICLQTLLGITKDSMQNANNAAARLIAVKNTRKNLLRDFTGVAVQNTDYAALGSDALRASQIDGMAGSIYALITAQNGNLFWDRKLLTV